MRRLQLILAMLSTALVSAHAPARPNVAFEAYRAQIAAAEKSLRLDETRELHRWLDACDPVLRGWEWAHLTAIADTSVRSIRMPGTPRRIVMSPDGRRLATVEGSTVRVMSWPQLDELQVIDGHGDAVYRAAFSPDGTRLLTVSRDVTSRAWDVASGAELARIELANPAVAAVAIDPAGVCAATCAWERDEAGNVHGVVWLWNPATGDVMHRHRVGVKPLSSIAFTPDGASVLVGSWDGLVHVLDRTGNETGRLTLPDDGIYNAVNDIAISPDGRFVAAAAKDRTVRVFALDNGALAATLRGHDSYVEGVAFSPDGSTLATSSVDATVALWPTETWTRRTVLRGARDTVRGAAWTKDNAAVLACSLDGSIRQWASDTNDSATTTIRTGADGNYSTTMSPDGRTVAVACFDGWMRMFDSHSGALRLEWDAHRGSSCHGAAFSADGRRLITASWDGTARVWNPEDGRELAVLDAGNGVSASAITRDGALAATSSRTLQIWNVDRQERLHTIAVDGAQPTQVAFSTDANMIASGWSDGFARIYDPASGRLLAVLGTADAPRASIGTITFLNGDAQLATADAAGVVRLFSTDGGDARFAIDTGGRAVHHVSASGDRIAVATDQLWLIDASDGGIVLGTTPHADSIWHLSWSPDGRRLATCAIAGVIKILDGAPAAAPNR